MPGKYFQIISKENIHGDMKLSLLSDLSTFMPIFVLVQSLCRDLLFMTPCTIPCHIECKNKFLSICEVNSKFMKLPNNSLKADYQKQTRISRLHNCFLEQEISLLDTQYAELIYFYFVQPHNLAVRQIRLPMFTPISIWILFAYSL